MKKILVTISAITLLVSCNKKTEGYTISGDLKGIEDGTLIYLEKQDGFEMIKLDSTEVKDGKFEINGNTDDVSISMLNLGDDGIRIPFVLENGKINIEFDTANQQDAKMGGTPNNDDFYTFNQEAGKIQKKIQEFQNSSQEVFMNARMNNNTKVVDSLMDINSKMINELETYNLEFIEKRPKSYMAMLILSQMAQGGSIELEKSKELFDKMDADVKETQPGKDLQEYLDKVSKVSIGQKAPDFSAPNPEGKTVSLKESLGKVTIIDFWASWCGPCRMENPNVVRIYNKYHDKGLNIIGVSLDKDGDKWKEAIEKDQLEWAQISNLQFWEDPIAADYSVRAIPATFILDENGVIVAKDLRGDELESKIKELLNL